MEETLEERILNLIKQLEEEKRLADKRAKQLYDLAGAGGGAAGPHPFLFLGY